LMLRELESATDGGLTVLLNGAASHLVGEAPDTNFEVAVQAAGSIADCALRAGHPVTLLLPDARWRPIRLSPNAESRRRLLAILAAAAPRGLSELGPSLRALAGGARKHARSRSLTLIVLRLDRSLVRAVATLREAGLPVAIVHVVGDRRGAATSAGEDLDLRRSLVATGVRYLPVGRVEDLRAALSEWPEARRARVR
jgi:uncharacterized protein (DUF58 family)